MKRTPIYSAFLIMVGCATTTLFAWQDVPRLNQVQSGGLPNPEASLLPSTTTTVQERRQRDEDEFVLGGAYFGGGETILSRNQIPVLLKLYQDVASSPADREKVAASIKAEVEKEFDSRQEAREKQLKQLEEQIKKLRDLQQRRLSEKEKIVQFRVEALLREADGLGWGNDMTEFWQGSSLNLGVAPAGGINKVREIPER